MQLEEFYDYKNQLMDDLLTNAEIIRLLDDNYKDSDQPERFVYSQVFPFEYVPDTIEHGQTFICTLSVTCIYTHKLSTLRFYPNTYEISAHGSRAPMLLELPHLTFTLSPRSIPYTQR